MRPDTPPWNGPYVLTIASVLQLPASARIANQLVVLGVISYVAVRMRMVNCYVVHNYRLYCVS